MTGVPHDAPGPDPLVTFAQWREASAGALADPDALALATSTLDGQPSVRLVLLRGITDVGLRFFTNYESRKGRELSENPRAAAVWFDASARRQIRVEGSVAKLEAAASDAYFSSRDRGHQLGAVASHQSSELADRDSLERAYLDAEHRFEGRDVERPARWGGYLLTATAVELWTQRDDRLHDRFAYARDGGGWSAVRLAP